MTAPELMPCPICESAVQPTFVGLHANTVSCFKGECLYRVRAEDHNTLCRRAEVGALVELLTPESGRNLTIQRNEPGFGVFRTGRLGRGPTLLDALRSLAAEVTK